MSKYDNVTLIELPDHVFTNYGQMDDHLVNANRAKFEEPPEMDALIDTYFSKQEECQLMAIDSDTPIIDADMAQKLSTHMGKTGLVSKHNYRFK